MPRTARLDAPGILYHVIIPGIERRKIFRTNKDREGFIERLEVLKGKRHAVSFLSCFGTDRDGSNE